MFRLHDLLSYSASAEDGTTCHAARFHACAHEDVEAAFPGAAVELQQT